MNDITVHFKGEGRRRVDGEWELKRKEEGEKKEGRGPIFRCFGKASGDTCRIYDFDKFGTNFGRLADRWPPVRGFGCGRGGGGDRS